MNRRKKKKKRGKRKKRRQQTKRAELWRGGLAADRGLPCSCASRRTRQFNDIAHLTYILYFMYCTHSSTARAPHTTPGQLPCQHTRLICPRSGKDPQPLICCKLCTSCMSSPPSGISKPHGTRSWRARSHRPSTPGKSLPICQRSSGASWRGSTTSKTKKQYGRRRANDSPRDAAGVVCTYHQRHRKQRCPY